VHQIRHCRHTDIVQPKISTLLDAICEVVFDDQGSPVPGSAGLDDLASAAALERELSQHANNRKEGGSPFMSAAAVERELSQSQYMAEDPLFKTPTSQAASLPDLGFDQSEFQPGPTKTDDALISEMQSLRSQVAQLSTTLKSKDATLHSCLSCSDHVLQEQSLAADVEWVRQAWLREKQEHTQNRLRFEQNQAIVNACDATFRNLRYIRDGAIDGDKPLSQIAQETISSHHDELMHKFYKDAESSLDHKSSRLKRRARDLLETHRICIATAQDFNNELATYSAWLESKKVFVEQSYRRYCEIMQEAGTRPQLLYEDENALSEAGRLYTGAFGAQAEAAGRAFEAAHLDGMPGPL
jgi:hypothetical protein